jgi:hypothetical protein
MSEEEGRPQGYGKPKHGLGHLWSRGEMVGIWRVYIGGLTFQDLARPLTKENDDVVLWPELPAEQHVDGCLGVATTTHFDNWICFC